MRLILVVAVGLASCVVVVSSAVAGDAAATVVPKCTKAMNKTGTVKTITSGSDRLTLYCGPAKATLNIGGKKSKIVGGACGSSTSQSTSMGFFIGVLTYRAKKQVNRFVSMVIRPKPKRPGTYVDGAKWDISTLVQAPGTDFSGPAKVVLKKGLRSGTFSAKQGGKPITVTWACGN